MRRLPREGDEVIDFCPSFEYLGAIIHQNWIVSTGLVKLFGLLIRQYGVSGTYVSIPSCVFTGLLSSRYCSMALKSGRTPILPERLLPHFYDLLAPHVWHLAFYTGTVASQ